MFGADIGLTTKHVLKIMAEADDNSDGVIEYKECGFSLSCLWRFLYGNCMVLERYLPLVYKTEKLRAIIKLCVRVCRPLLCALSVGSRTQTSHSRATSRSQALEHYQTRMNSSVLVKNLVQLLRVRSQVGESPSPLPRRRGVIVKNWS